MGKPQEIIIASHNKDKIRELRQILSELDIKVYSTLDFPNLADVDEDQDSLEGNALKKAKYVFENTKIPSLSDDTGLEVEALNGKPGVYSARFAGEDATYADNLAKLMQEMDSKKNRTAQFKTVMALVTKNAEYLFEGICKGEITEQPKGENGFGYDPVFQPKGYEQTFAELNQKIKNEISHRAKATQKFLNYLKTKS